MPCNVGCMCCEGVESVTIRDVGVVRLPDSVVIRTDVCHIEIAVLRLWVLRLFGV